MKQIVFLLLTQISILQPLMGQEIPLPKNYSIVDTVTGDLDEDLKKELVVAYNTDKDQEEEGVLRELIIYKIEQNNWIVWKKSLQALYGSRDGGMMGDPFGEIKVENGILLISQNGGSSWKWNFTDKYRFQDGNFYLTGYTSTDGKPCEYWQEVDFNLSTGIMVVNTEYEDCENENQDNSKKENETLVEKGLKITLENRQEKEIKIVSPKYSHEIYISTGR